MPEQRAVLFARFVKGPMETGGGPKVRANAAARDGAPAVGLPGTQRWYAGESSWTAATIAAACSGGTSGCMPWPRLKTWPGPAP